VAEAGPTHGATNQSATERPLPNELTASNRPVPAGRHFLIERRVHVAHRSFVGVGMKGERRRKWSSACTRTETAAERQLSLNPAANYRPYPVTRGYP